MDGDHQRMFLQEDTDLLSPTSDTSPSHSLHSELSDDSGIVPSFERAKRNCRSGDKDKGEKSVSDWGVNARRSWISHGHSRVNDDSHGEVEENEDENNPSFIDLGDASYRDQPRRGENFRRFSTACAPIRAISEYVPIPEVIITSIEDEEEGDAEPLTPVPPRLRMLRRSMSSPDGVLSQLSQEACIKIANLAMEQQEGTNYVTLEDVEKFKRRRRRSGASSINSFNDEMFQMIDETWSYTNFSSSQASDTKAGDPNCLSDGDEVDAGTKDEEANIEVKNVLSHELHLSTASETSKESSWKKLRKMVRWIPFIQIYRKKKYPWVQLAGHSGNFLKGIKQGTVLKKHNLAEESCYLALMNDILKEVVPTYFRRTSVNGKDYMELQCCLSQFQSPNLMDIKIGTRTFLEDEATICKPRKDLYEKMVKEDPEAPTTEETSDEAVSKYRYMDWRDCISSTRTLGFRIEGTTIDGKSSRNYKTARDYDVIRKTFEEFSANQSIKEMYLERLRLIKKLCERSAFFSTHELIGSSLLFVHDKEKASIWMIDFEKTRNLDGNISITHDRKWEQENHEDGYLIGLNSLIQLFET